MIDIAIGGGAGGADLALEKRVEGPLHVARSKRAAIVKFDVVAEVEDVGERIGDFPAFGESGRDVEMIVAIQQSVENKFVNSLGLRVDAYARIEIGGAALDDHDERVGVGRLRTGEKRE